MKLAHLYESVPSPIQQQLLKSVTETLRRMAPDVHVKLYRADWNDWMTIKIGNQSCSFKVDADKTLHLSQMYLPEELRQKGVMTAMLKGIKAELGSKLGGKCKVDVPMNVAGWKQIVERAGFTWVPPMSREEFLQRLKA